MSYADDIRGAVASVAGAARRVMALRELGLPAEEEQKVQDCLDRAADELLTVVSVLSTHGHTSTGMHAVAGGAGSAGADKSWRQSVYGGRKDTGVTHKRATVRTPAASAPAIPEEPVDVAHPWRTEDRRAPEPIKEVDY